MYHPLTPRQSWVQSPVSFRKERGRVREGELEKKRGGNITGHHVMWANKKVQIRLDVGNSFTEGK